MLNKTKLKSEIKSALLDQRNKKSDPVKAADQLAGAIADAIDDYVRGITITYTAGLVNNAGPVTGSFQHTVS